MSRIDEALRRVSGEPIAAVTPADFERSKNRSAEDVLDRYPVENPGRIENPGRRTSARRELAPGY